MLLKYLIITGSVALFLCPLNSSGQWSLSECINHALENNIQIKQQHLNVEYNANALDQSKAVVLPSLNGNIGQNYSWGRSVDPYTNDFTTNNFSSLNMGISSTFIVFNGFQNYNTIKQNRLNLLASIEDVEKMKNDISLNIAAMYLQILFNRDMLEMSEKQMEITKLQIERTAKLVEAGSVPEGSLMEVEAQLASEELAVVNNRNQLDISMLTMTQLLELDSAEGFDIVVPELPELEMAAIEYSIDDIFVTATANMPQIRSAELKLQSAEKGLAIAKGGRSPRLSMTASWGTGYSSSYETFSIDSTSVTMAMIGLTTIGTETYYVYAPQFGFVSETTPFGDQFRNNGNYSLGFNLSIPIFNGLQVSKSVSNAKINMLNNEYALELARNQLYKDIQQSYTDVLAALKKYYSSKKALESIQKSFDYTKEKYDVGLVTFVDYNIARQTLVKTESDLIQAKYEYIFKSKILDFYRGIPINL